MIYKMQIRIICPTCKTEGNIEISPEIMKNASRGLVAINIAPGIICPHTFFAYVDKNFQVRDYFVADFHVELPEITAMEKVKSTTNIPKKEIIDIDLIKLNLSATLITYLLNSILSKQKVVILMNQEFLYKHVMNFFNYIFQDTFDTDITLISQQEYEKNKKNYKNSMVFQGNEILNNYKNLLKPKKLNIEKHIVNRFLSEQDLGFSYIILRNEITKAHELSQKIIEIVESEKAKGEKINMLKIQAELEKAYDIKIDTKYLEFLVEIMRNYYEISVPSLVDSFFNVL